VLEQRDRLRLRVRMNFTVMRSNVEDLPAMVRLAQELEVQLYLNLATDHTFLFRDGQVSIETRVNSDRISAVMALVEERLRSNRRFVPRYSELAYVQRHFDDQLQGDLPCAESQLKIMIHSTGELGGCWGHDAAQNVRDTSVAEILEARSYREEHSRFFRKECVGCGSNYALNLAWRPGTYVEDVLWRLGKRQLAHVRTA
jgi:MoaA/NifB/PqqE/SkfB family radical SAM enzyme